MLKMQRWIAGTTAALALCSTPSRAALIVYKTPTGSTTSGPVSAEADFSTAAGSLTVTLKNLQANPTDVAQLISDFSFHVGNGGSLSGSSLTGASAREITVNGDDSFTLGSTLTTPSAVGFVYSGSGASGLLDVLGAGGAGPSHLIIGPPDGSGMYSNGNGSIAGNKPHNPFLDQSATFTITGTGLTAATTITGATFSFGTSGNVEVTGAIQPQTVPEPATVSMALMGLGMLTVAAVRGRRRRLPATAA